jgi:salicylate biosynthesis isochorismate synthase/menaquinone-specific isochorismate synthase
VELGTGSAARQGRGTPFSLDRRERERLHSSLRAAVDRARRSGRPTLATLTLELPPDADPAALACASRRTGEPWFLLEQPDRGRAALAGLGEAAALSARGERRFAEVAERWRELAAAAVSDPGEAPGDGPVAVGGFAFAPAGGRAPCWEGFEPASLIVPEVALVRGPRLDGGAVRMTLAALACPDDLAEELLARLTARVEELRHAPLPLLDPAPAGRFHVSSAMPPEHYEQAVARAVELIAAEQLEKIVLAREVQVHAPRRYDPAALRSWLPAPSCSCAAKASA